MTSRAEAASRCGIDAAYVDAFDREQAVGDATLQSLIDAVGEPVVGALSPIVVRPGKAEPIRLASTSVKQAWTLQSADGDAAANGFTAKGALTLPVGLTGSYRLMLEDGRRCAVLAAPGHAYQPPFFARGKRGWILATQLYGVRTKRNWGHGDFTDLAMLLRIAAQAGAAGIGVNPLHALFDDRPGGFSPYTPNSRLFLNPLYIDIEAVPDFPGIEAASFEEAVAGLRNTEFVDYAAVSAAKRRALRLAYDAFRADASAERRDDFDTFRLEHGPALESFAAFETLRHRLTGPWWEWPEEWRTPRPDALRRLRGEAPDEFAFHEYAQWIADRQLGACRDEAKRLGLPIGLYLDIAVGAAPDGADAWSEQEGLLRGVSVGAPPDRYNSNGQDWGLATFNPRALAATDFRPFRQMLRAAMRYAGAIRLDHVLGLNRIFLVPAGRPPKEGAYLRFPFDAMLAVVAQESAAAQCLVIGEDLGTVPQGFVATLNDWGVWSYRVMLFERGTDGAFHDPSAYPADALVSFSTHDFSTFAGWLADHDLRTKRAIGVDPGETDAEREAARAALLNAVNVKGAQPAMTDVLRFLARTPTRLLSLALEDVFAVHDQPNVPGTIDEHPNWRRRTPLIEDGLPELAALAAVLTAESRSARTAEDARKARQRS